jgi:ribA/ribD-fused uncharacterized protein
MIKEFSEENRWLSNFAKVSITYNEYTYNSVEAAYQAQKYNNPDWKRFCVDPKNTPGLIKKSSRFIKLVENWEDIKVQVMEELLVLKFKQEPYKTLLKNTGDEYIQEGNYWEDKYWGVCLKTNQGENHLGKIIMDIRKEIIE